MEKVNRRALFNLKGRASQSLQNFAHTAVKVLPAIGLSVLCLGPITTPVLAANVEPVSQAYYADYAFVPYNENWGNQEVYYLFEVKTTKNGLGVLDKNHVDSKILEAVYRTLGEDKVKRSRYNMITYDLKEEEGLEYPIIDVSSFEFYKKSSSTLSPLKKANVYLPVTIFISPDNQHWVNEASYAEYAKEARNVYECSDGSLVFSYQAFKNRERELAYHPGKPDMTPTPTTNRPLSRFIYTELGSDGTIWKNQTLLEEYLHWRQDHNYGVKDGVYVGVYGTAANFEEYMKIYNVSYFISEGLKRSEQYYGAYGFLYSSASKAQASIEALNSYQKTLKSDSKK